MSPSIGWVDQLSASYVISTAVHPHPHGLSSHTPSPQACTFTKTHMDFHPVNTHASQGCFRTNTAVAVPRYASLCIASSIMSQRVLLEHSGCYALYHWGISNLRHVPGISFDTLYNVRLHNEGNEGCESFRCYFLTISVSHHSHLIDEDRFSAAFSELHLYAVRLSR